MMFSEHVRMALASVRAARFRSFLTMLGVIIGVVSVITTMSLGEGVKHQVASQAEGAGKDVITVRPGSLVKRDDSGAITGINLLSMLSSSKLTEKDYETVKNDPGVDIAVPLSVIPATPTYANGQYKDSFVMATNHQLPEVIKQKVESGNFFEASESDRRVAVIGFNVAERLFKENVPLGKTFHIRGQSFVVGGVLEKFPTNPLNPDINFNDGIFIPYQTGKTLVNDQLDSYEILVKPKNIENPDATVEGLISGIKNNHAGQEDFTVLGPEETKKVANSVIGVITKTITIIAAVALFVGGIGIMNVMLVSVTERTREIGIRKAVGATNRQIQTQFLIEAVVISIWGAVIGIVTSIIINIILRITTSLEPIITWQVVLASALVSVGVGIVFGMIPAVKASRKDPINSLRSF